MSVINKMLQDLDSRQVGDDSNATGLAGIHATAAVEMESENGLRLWLIALGGTFIIVAVSLAVLWWYGSRPVQRWEQVPPRYFQREFQLAATAAPTASAPVPALAPALTLAVPAVSPMRQPAAAPAVSPASAVAASATVGAHARDDEEISASGGPVATPRVLSAREQEAILQAKRVRALTPQEQAENAYRQAVQALQHSNATAAETLLRQALQLDAGHLLARQALVALLVDARRLSEAEQVSRAGLSGSDPAGFAMILARLQLERKDRSAALATLRQYYSAGQSRAEYEAFYAALLQEDGQHGEAARHYRMALQQQPQQGVWWMGLGLALKADGNLAEARSAFTQALQSNSLTPALTAFVQQQLAP